MLPSVGKEDEAKELKIFMLCGGVLDVYFLLLLTGMQVAICLRHASLPANTIRHCHTVSVSWAYEHPIACL